ncbi:MAG: calcium/sodium antiporter [Patescibacteria group bacterium]
MIYFWILVFVLSVGALIKGADWFTVSAERIGLALGLTPFIVGVTIVGAGTSFPELISSMAGALRGVTDIVAANVIGSNIANILLIVGLASVFAKKLTVSKNLIDLDIPLLAASTALLLGVVWDQTVTFGEGVLLVIVYCVYLTYTVVHVDDEVEVAVLPSRVTRREHIVQPQQLVTVRPTLRFFDIGMLVLGLLVLIVSAKYLIDSLIALSSLTGIAVGVISITAVAVGTSLPELIVSLRAAMRGKTEVALGNIFGSNVFNGLIVLGFPGLFRQLHVDDQTFMIGVPTLIVATLLFVISGISRRIHMWEGAFFVAIYVLFVSKLFGWL